MAFFKTLKDMPLQSYKDEKNKTVNIFHEDIIKLAHDNKNFRKEVKTANNSQIVLMSLEPNESIGAEVHHVDQILFFVTGIGLGIMNGNKFSIHPNDLVFVPAGTEHNFINTGIEALKLFTIYAPPEHRAGTIHKTKAEAEKAEGEETAH